MAWQQRGGTRSWGGGGFNWREERKEGKRLNIMLLFYIKSPFSRAVGVKREFIQKLAQGLFFVNGASS